MPLRGLGKSAFTGTFALRDLSNVSNADFYNKALESGVIGSGTAYVAISYVDGTTPLVSLAVGRWIDMVQFRILDTWDGIGARIRVGILGDLGKYADSNTDADLTEAIAFETDVNTITSGAEDIIITIDPGVGATQGSAYIGMSF